MYTLVIKEAIVIAIVVALTVGLKVLKIPLRQEEFDWKWCSSNRRKGEQG